ncbi:diguanylate cyclase domain-containing protein [Sanguibacter antarcticus]|uniref:Diguanylate cyclase with GGDEF domain n=1 Tax=Sanguibacter antarcticus TaxID=372484 RepID=A0A2A9E8U3_9MICO|nr:diguanylate cyclase [Sanguibacter antarcticus]PFG34580.1 diguanylate cyclase with GGDEF domain [Sanguibacter antarcticus]
MNSASTQAPTISPADVSAGHPARVPTVSDVSRPLEVVESTMSCRSLEELFRPERVESVAVQYSGDSMNVGLITRERCAAAMSGELGYGRALLYRKHVSELTDWSPTVVDPWCTVADALRIAMARPRPRRYDDLVVRAQVWASVSVSALVDALSGDVATVSDDDHLTGLRSRTAWLDALGAQSVAGTASSGYLAVVVVSLRGVSAVNSELGLDAGDAVLVSIADGLRNEYVPRSTLGRLSGTQMGLFAALAGPDDADAVAQGEAVARRVRSAAQTALRAVTAELGAQGTELRACTGYAVAPVGVLPGTLLTYAVDRTEP